MTPAMTLPMVCLLLVGESFRDAAQRGLAEELGIAGAVLPQQPLGPVHRRRLVVPGLYVDYELVESYKLQDLDGQVGWQRMLGMYRRVVVRYKYVHTA